jgi:hypothetical protein
MGSIATCTGSALTSWCPSDNGFLDGHDSDFSLISTFEPTLASRTITFTMSEGPRRSKRLRLSQADVANGKCIPDDDSSSSSSGDDGEHEKEFQQMELDPEDGASEDELHKEEKADDESYEEERDGEEDEDEDDVEEKEEEEEEEDDDDDDKHLSYPKDCRVAVSWKQVSNDKRKLQRTVAAQGFYCNRDVSQLTNMVSTSPKLKAILEKKLPDWNPSFPLLVSLLRKNQK